MKHRGSKHEEKAVTPDVFSILLRIKPDLGDWLTRIAERGGRSRNDLIAEWLGALRDAVEHVERTKAAADGTDAYTPTEAMGDLQGYLAKRLCALDAAPYLVLLGRAEACESAAGWSRGFAADAKSAAVAAHLRSQAAEADREATELRMKADKLRGEP